MPVVGDDVSAINVLGVPGVKEGSLGVFVLVSGHIAPPLYRRKQVPTVMVHSHWLQLWGIAHWHASYSTGLLVSKFTGDQSIYHPSPVLFLLTKVWGGQIFSHPFRVVCADY